jgi:hypothetical protein
LQEDELHARQSASYNKNEEMNIHTDYSLFRILNGFTQPGANCKAVNIFRDRNTAWFSTCDRHLV